MALDDGKSVLNSVICHFGVSPMKIAEMVALLYADGDEDTAEQLISASRMKSREKMAKLFTSLQQQPSDRSVHPGKPTDA